MQGLPVNGRQMSQLMLQAPGSQNAGTGTWGDIRFSGRAVEQNVIKYDGVEASGVIDSAPGVANGENASLFKLQASLENVQEFRVESSGYPAEFGTGTGGQISVITKSGGNRFRGSVFEYLRSDKMDARELLRFARAMPTTASSRRPAARPTVPKSPLKLNQFGGSIGGPLVKDRVFFFGSYEGYRLDAGRNLIQARAERRRLGDRRAGDRRAAVRRSRRRTRADLPGASTDPAFDIAAVAGRTQDVNENAFSARAGLQDQRQLVVVRPRVPRPGRELRSRRTSAAGCFHMTINPTNAIFNLQGILRRRDDQRVQGRLQRRAEHRGARRRSRSFENIALSLAGNVANAGIAGPGRARPDSASPGGLVRVNSAGNGRGAPYNPYSLTFADSVSRVAGNHYMKMGADVRLIRMTHRPAGRHHLHVLQRRRRSWPTRRPSIQYFGDLSEPSPFHNGASGTEAHQAGVLRRLRAGRMARAEQPHAELRPPVRLLRAPARSRQPDRQVQHRHGPDRSGHDAVLQVEEEQLPAATVGDLFADAEDRAEGRRSASSSARDRRKIRFSRSKRSASARRVDERTASRVYPVDPAAIRANFTNNPNNRSFQPRAYADDYTLPEKVYQYTASLQQEIGWQTAASIAYVGSQGRNLFLRSIANRTDRRADRTGATAAFQVREFDIVTCADGTVATAP